MRIPKLNSVILIEWIDAYAQSEWTDRVVIDGDMARCSSVGHLIRNDRPSITIAGSLGHRDDTVADCLTIPKSLITAIKVLK